MEIPLAAETIGHIGKLPITNTLLMSWLVISTLAILAILATRKLARVPGKIQNVLELVIEAADNMIRDLAGNKGRVFLPLVLTFFLFILISNWMGLLPGLTSIGFWEMEEGHKIFVPLLRSGNSDLNITLGLGLVSVVVTQILGLKFQGLWGYFKHYFHNPLSGGIIFIVAGIGIGAFVGVLELISEFVKIVSLSFRLFGNIYAGEAVLATVSGIFAYLAPLPFLMLEGLVGIVQAAVFALLTLVFISIITAGHEESAEQTAH
ncbi:MAG: F0F1 ATP synthase subunit A [bacterium]|nr:F0F1 ATP synthase subunit A [bacterium]